MVRFVAKRARFGAAAGTNRLRPVARIPPIPVSAAGPHVSPVPACGQFPVSEWDRHAGCVILFEHTRAEPCECTPPEDGCEPICAVPEPPSLPDACAGVTSDSENPAGCSATGNVVTYAVTKIAADAESASGFDLDGTAGSSCVEGALTVPDAPDGVDNSLAAVDLSLLNRELFNRACKGAVTTSFQVDANVEQACATFTVLDSGDVVASARHSISLTPAFTARLTGFLLPLLRASPARERSTDRDGRRHGLFEHDPRRYRGRVHRRVHLRRPEDAPDFWVSMWTFAQTST